MSIETPRSALVGDLWGGLASTLVALPASIAFGVAVYAPLGSGAGAGALAGLLGATALGTIAPILGGTPRLVSAPCAPAVAVMGAFALQMAAKEPADPARVILLMTLVGLLAATLQVGFGLARGGTIIKYIPYPVVAGYMSGVGVVIFLKQLPVLLGLPSGTTLAHGVVTPSLWQPPALVVGAVTIAAMALSPRFTKAVPAAILGLIAGVLGYLVLAAFHPELRRLAGNALIIGPLGGTVSSLVSSFQTRLAALGSVHASDAALIVGPATTLAVVLSLDTLKTCVVVDAITGSQHESNRELFGQGIANACSAVIGGMPGAGTSGATLVNVASGAQTRWSAVLEGALVLFAFLTLGGVVAWAPLAALAGILVVVAWRMVDWHALRWARRSSTALDFGVVVAVVAVAVGIDLILSSAVGVALSILLFIRNESRVSVIRRKLEGNKVFSKRRRPPEQMAALVKHGGETVVVQLQGSLFFGTTDQLRTQLRSELETRRTIIFDMRRVDALDLTAAHIFEQMRTQLEKRGARAVLCNLPYALSGQRDVESYLRELGMISADDQHSLFSQLSDALAWAEDRILREQGVAESAAEGVLALEDLGLFEGRKKETIADLLQCVEARDVAVGGAVFRHGQAGDEIFFLRNGTVRISLPFAGRSLHVASFGRGDFFGEIAFLDGGERTADAIAETDVKLFVISRKRFDTVAAIHPRLAQSVFSSLARALALRLRRADGEIITLEEA